MKYAILPATPFEQNGSFLQCDVTGKVAVVGDVLFSGSIGQERQHNPFVADHRG